MNVTGGSTDVTTYVALTLLADGTDATGLTITDLDLQYVRSGATPAAKVDATALAATNSAHGDNQAIEIDATDQPGLYRVDWPDAAFAAGVKEVVLSVKHTLCKTAHLRVSIDPPVNVTKWLTETVATPTTNGVPEVDVTFWRGQAVPATNQTGVPIVDIEYVDGTGVDPAGTVDANVVSILDDAQSATDLKDFADAGYDPATNKVQGVVLVDTATDLTNLPAAAATAAELAKVPKSDGTATWNATALASIQSESNDALVAFFTSAAALVDNIWDEVIDTSAHNGADSAGQKLRRASSKFLAEGTVDPTGATTTSFRTDLTEGDDHWNDALLTFISGDLAGQSRTILDYANVNGLITLDEALTGIPAGGVKFIIESTHIHPVTQIQSGLALASVCTEGRLAELDAANLPADIDTIKADGPNKPTRGVQLSNLPFLMVDETDFATPETGVTVTATISKDGGSFSACANAAAEIGNGVYKITLTSTETDAAIVVLRFTGTGCAQTTMALATQPT